MIRRENLQSTNADFKAAVQALYQKGVRLWTENGVLRYRAPKGVITYDDIAILRRLDTASLPASPLSGDEGPLQPFSCTGPLRLAPMSFNQLSHWHLRGTTGHRPIRQVASVTKIRGRLQTAAMTEAVSVAVARHGSLRTNIVDRDGELMQQVAERGNSSLQLLDMTDVPQQERDQEMHRQINSTIVDVTDYSCDPLFRAVLLKLEDAESVLILAMDHMVSDGTSRSILEREVFTAYEQLVVGHEVSLPKVQMQYADHAIWQRSLLSDHFKAQESRPSTWRRTSFPGDGSEPGERGLGQARFTLTSSLRLALQEFAQRKGTTLVMTILTAYVALVMRWCDVFDTVIQVMSSGRNNRLVENTVGFVAYPLYLHISVDHGATLTELLEAITAEYCRACERPDFYYSYTLKPTPPFTQNTCFNWLPRSGGVVVTDSVESAGLNSRSPVVFDNPVLESFDDLDMEPSIAFEDLGSRISGSVGFARRRFSTSTMVRFAKALGVFLDAVTVSPTKCIREIAIT